MALPAGRYGVTKAQLLKIKKLPMNTIKLIEELIEKYNSLGTAATKNSTSVVTQSTDLVESGAVKDIVGWGNKNKFDINGYSTSSNTTRTILNDGINVKSSSASWASYIYFFTNDKNTDMRFKTSLYFVSGHTQVIVYGNSTPATAGATSIISSEVYTADGNVDLQFNSGDYEYLVIRFFVTTGTTEVGEANFNSIMLCKASDGGTYEPYHESVEQTLRDANLVNGKNLLVFPYYELSKGVITANNDGSVNINGTPTSRTVLFLKNRELGVNLPKGNYILNGVGSLQNVTITIDAYNDATWVKNIAVCNASAKEVAFALEYVGYNTLSIYIAVDANTSHSNETVYPMIRKATESDPTYEPYYIPLKDALPNKCDNSVIGTVEDGTNPTKAYAVGEHMIRGGKFCTVTVAVTTSSTWTLNGNYVEGDIASALVYKAGDTISINSNLMPFLGYATSGATEIYFTIPLDRKVVASGFTIISAATTIRGVEGYVVNNDSSLVFAKSGINNNSIGVKVTKSDNSAFTVTNNTPVAVDTVITVTFS